MAFSKLCAPSMVQKSPMPDIEAIQKELQLKDQWVVTPGAGAPRWTYLNTPAYTVDMNVECSSSAATTNSCCRGVSGCVAVDAAISLQVRRRGTRSLTHPRSPRASRTMCWEKGVMWRDSQREQV